MVNKDYTIWDNVFKLASTLAKKMADGSNGKLNYREALPIAWKSPEVKEARKIYDAAKDKNQIKKKK